MSYLDTLPFIHIQETDSTNNYLSRLCDRGPIDEFTTVLTDFQTSGKGQRGNCWESEKSANLLYSFVFYPVFLEARRQFILSQIVSLAVYRELSQQAEGFSVKWPNDIYWKDKKIAGILIENDLSGSLIGRCITGIGININQEKFSGRLPNPVSLSQITNRRHDKLEILGNIMKRTRTYYEMLKEKKADSITGDYQEALFRKEGMYRYSDADGEFIARIAGVEADGHLILEDQNGKRRRYAFKEVEYVL